jgi:excisionase family DNA binding protein
MTIQDVSEALQVTPKTVRRYIREGKLPAEQRRGAHGPQWEIDPEAVNAYTRRSSAVEVMPPEYAPNHDLSMDKVTHEFSTLRQVIARQSEEIANLGLQIEALREAIPPITKPRPWWQWWRS